MSTDFASYPLVSIVAPVYNGAKYIEESILSVLNQTYPHIEYIIMDGGSTDETVAIAQRYANRLTIISEKDKGQSDAINKGWKHAQGDILAWLNADDLYLPDTVEKAVAYLQAHPEMMWVYGSAQFVTEEGEPGHFRYPIYEYSYEELLSFGSFIPQPTVFLRRSVIERFGYIDEDLHYGMDYEYWLRIGKAYPAGYVPAVRAIVKIFRETKSRSGGYKRLIEMDTIVRRHGGTDLPKTMRHQWVEAVLDLLVEDIRKGRWKDFRADFKKLGRFPGNLPHGVMKWIMRHLLPPALENRLRKWFVPASS